MANSKLFPLLNSIRSSSSADLRQDFTAGLTTAIMLVPQAMAYALLAGLDPIIGLYAAALPTAIYALLGTSSVLAVGPVAMVSLLVAGGVGPIAGDDPVLYSMLAAMLMLQVGLIQFFMGVFRTGFLVKYLSHPVIAGFTSAAALIIGFSQFKHLLGLNIPRSHHIHTIIGQAIDQVSDIHVITLLIAVSSIVGLVVMKSRTPKLPRFLIVVLASVVVVWLFGLDQYGVKIVGEVPSGLPGFSIPSLDGNQLAALLPTAITISLVGFMESIAVAKNFARTNGDELDANQELRALGLANLGGALFHGYPVTGGFSRTAVNAQAGARSGLASLTTAAIVALSLVLFTPMFYYLPKAVLAAIIVTAVFGLIDHKEARHLWRLSKSDFWMMALTFFATLSLGIEQGIAVGVGGSLLWFVIRNSKPHMAVMGQLPGLEIYRNFERYPEAQPIPHTVIVRLDAPLFFANTAFLEQSINSLIDARAHEIIRHFVIDASGIGNVDASGLGVLQDIAQDMNQRGIKLWLSAVNGPVRDALLENHFFDLVPEGQMVNRVHLAIEKIRALDN